MRFGNNFKNALVLAAVVTVTFCFCIGQSAFAGSIVAWGWNSYGQCSVPSPNSGFIAVAGGGFYHSLGLKDNNSIVAWGNNGYGECSVPEPNSGFIAVAAGFYHSLGLKQGGSIVAWGLNGSGQCSVPEPNSGFIAVAAGYNHSLGLKQDGSIVAWGYNGDGQCDVPSPNSGFVAVAAGGFHSLAIKQQLPSYGEILVYSVSINVTGVAGTVGEERNWELGRGRFHGYLVCDAALAGEPNTSLIVYGWDDTGDNAYERIDLILDEFYPVYNHPYVYTVGLSFDEAWRAVLTGNAEATDIGADGTTVVARRLTGHILINGYLPLPLSDDEGYGSGTVKARLNLNWTRECNIEELTLERAVNEIIEYLEDRGYEPYYRIM